jgi:methyl-accepting chemotaxis protein
VAGVPQHHAEPIDHKVVADLDALKALSQQYAQATAAAAHSAAHTGRTTIILGLMAGVLLAGAFALAMARALSRRLSTLEAVLAAMAEGDLTEREPDTAKHEIGRMYRSVHRAAAQNTIASAVEEQSATTNGMTGDLSRAAGGTAQISGQLGEVVQATGATRDAAHATQSAAADLTRISEELNTTVSGFRY